MTINDFLNTNEKPRLLLHVCCAPCFCGSIEKLTEHFDVTAFFYNPNIQPKEEFIKRENTLKTLIEHFPSVKLIVPEQDESEFLTASKGLEKEREGGLRCPECFKLRLYKTAEFLAEHKDEYDYFATTLTVSPHKNAPLINEIGRAAAKEFSVEYLDSDFKKQNGFLRSVTLAKELEIYRQNFCGCTFSRV